MVSHISIGRFVIGFAALVVFVYEGIRQMYRAKHVDRLEKEGKIASDMAARIRKKPMWLIDWSMIIFGIILSQSYRSPFRCRAFR
jgi:hypothetical protein